MIKLENTICRLTLKKEVVMNEIVLLEAAENYTVFKLQNGKNIIASRTMKHFENVLPENTFLRINRSIIINKQCIKKVSKHQLIMTNNQVVFISRRRIKFVLTNL
jgi:two-component system, LytTR family, response regulator